MTEVLAPSAASLSRLDIFRQLNEISVGVADVDAADGAARAGAEDGAQLDWPVLGFDLSLDGFDRTVHDQAEVGAAELGIFRRGQKLRFARVDVDLLLAEEHRVASAVFPVLHAEHARVEIDAGGKIGGGDDKMIETFYFHFLNSASVCTGDRELFVPHGTSAPGRFRGAQGMFIIIFRRRKSNVGPSAK